MDILYKPNFFTINYSLTILKPDNELSPCWGIIGPTFLLLDFLLEFKSVYPDYTPFIYTNKGITTNEVRYIFNFNKPSNLNYSVITALYNLKEEYFICIPPEYDFIIFDVELLIIGDITSQNFNQLFLQSLKVTTFGILIRYYYFKKIDYNKLQFSRHIQDILKYYFSTKDFSALSNIYSLLSPL